MGSRAEVSLELELSCPPPIEDLALCLGADLTLYACGMLAQTN